MPPEQNSSATNQTSVDQPVELRRSSDVWFDDGNYALQAENVVFKVYGGILSKYSSTFQTLLSLPQPVAEEERSMYENSPLIPLVGDSAHDVECYLKALFDLQWVSHNTPRPTLDPLILRFPQTLRRCNEDQGRQPDTGRRQHESQIRHRNPHPPFPPSVHSYLPRQPHQMGHPHPTATIYPVCPSLRTSVTVRCH